MLTNVRDCQFDLMGEEISVQNSDSRPSSGKKDCFFSPSSIVQSFLRFLASIKAVVVNLHCQFRIVICSLLVISSGYI